MFPRFYKWVDPGLLLRMASAFPIPRYGGDFFPVAKDSSPPPYNQRSFTLHRHSPQIARAEIRVASLPPCSFPPLVWLSETQGRMVLSVRLLSSVCCPLMAPWLAVKITIFALWADWCPLKWACQPNSSENMLLNSVKVIQFSRSWTVFNTILFIFSASYILGTCQSICSFMYLHLWS